jgi:hypothetical protein
MIKSKEITYKQTRTKMQLNFEQNKQQVQENDFPTDRGLRRRTKQLPVRYRTSYLNVFGPYFFEKLKNLDSSDTWLNVGGGELFAEVEYLTLEDFVDSEPASICVVSVESPDTDDFRKNYQFLQKSLGEKFVYMSGRRIEDIPSEELPKAQIVSDLYAAMAFSEHVDETLQKELALLEVGGTLFTTMDKVFIQNTDEEKIGRKKYISSIQGAKLIDKTTRFNPIIIEKKDALIVVPHLELTKFLSDKNVRNPKGLPKTMLNCERYYLLK